MRPCALVSASASGIMGPRRSASTPSTSNPAATRSWATRRRCWACGSGSSILGGTVYPKVDAAEHGGDGVVERPEVTIHIGQAYAMPLATILKTIVGSGVAVCLFDPVAQ